MAKGENIFKRKDGQWEARYIKGHELSGKIKYGYCYGKTYKEAKEKVTERKTALAAGHPLPPQRGAGKLARYCDEWLQLNRSRVKEATYVKYGAILEKHIKPQLGDCAPNALTTAAIGQYTRGLLEEGLAPKTVRDILTVLRSLLRYLSAQYPGLVPPLEIVYPKEDRKEMRVLDKAEQERLTRYLLTDMDACRFGILLALSTGMRIGEICALRWEDISLPDRTVRIHATMQRLKDLDGDGAGRTKIVIGPPKSRASVRTVPMTAQIAALCARMQQEDRTAFVLTGTRQHMEPRTMQYRLKRYTQDCALEDVHFHTLRHTFATRCVEVGFEIKTLSEILGHSTTTVTLDRYVHPSMELKRNNMDKLDAFGM